MTTDDVIITFNMAYLLELKVYFRQLEHVTLKHDQLCIITRSPSIYTHEHNLDGQPAGNNLLEMQKKAKIQDVHHKCTPRELLNGLYKFNV